LHCNSNYHPWSNGFRLRAGAYYNNNNINLSAKSTGSITIGHTRFTTADRNEVQIRQLNQTETEEPCDVPSHLTDLLERSKNNLSKEQEIQLIK
jgi:hypothetical protein